MTLDELRQALGKVAYERYVEAHDGVIQVSGLTVGMPPWDGLDERDQIIWTHIAGAVLDTFMATYRVVTVEPYGQEDDTAARAQISRPRVVTLEILNQVFEDCGMDCTTWPNGPANVVKALSMLGIEATVDRDVTE